MQLVPHLTYHSWEDIASFWDSPSILINLHVRTKREPVSTLILAIILGLEAAGPETGISSLASQDWHYNQLREPIDKDIDRLEITISCLQDLLSSLAEVILQNRRGQDLLFLPQEGLCVAFKEECFYMDHLGIVKDSMGKVQEGLDKRKSKWKQSQGWFQSWFSTSPWLTVLVSTSLGPLLILLLLLTFRPSILNKLLQYIKQRLRTIQLTVIRTQYH